jgi:hypothetical protein
MARTLALRSPMMHGGDVTLLQRDLNRRLSIWRVPFALHVDGQFGEQTLKWARSVAYGLGIAQAELRHGVGPTVRRKIRDPHRRTRTELQRGHDRERWVLRLAAARRDANAGPKAAVAFAKRMAVAHVVEHPAGSNRGPFIDDWNRRVANPPGPYAYWCGAFANACLVAGGLPSHEWMRYCPWIEQHARAHVDGWRWYSPTAKPRAGWLALFTEGGVAGHVELVVAAGLPLRTIGGNTSSGTGSASNGGGVFAHDFSHYHGLPLRGFAAPNYHH